MNRRLRRNRDWHRCCLHARSNDRTVRLARASKALRLRKFLQTMTHQINQASSPVASDFTADVNFFDVRAAHAARPVVPLAEATSSVSPAPRRSWLFGAIAASAIVGSLTGIAAFSYYQRSNKPAPNYAVAPETITPPTSAAPVASVAGTPAPVAAAPSPAAMPATSAAETSSGINTPDLIERRAASTTLPAVVNTAARRETPPTNAPAANRAVVARDGERASRTEASEPRAAANRAETAPVAPARREATVASEPRETVRRETPTRPRRQAETRPANTDAESSRSARPGYVDAVRRAIGDRPARRRRQENADGDRLREIFEGQAPPR